MLEICLIVRHVYRLI